MPLTQSNKQTPQEDDRVEMVIVTVQLALHCKPEEAADAVNEILRDHQAHFSDGSCLYDYQIQPFYVKSKASQNDYEEGEAFANVGAMV